MKKTLLRMLSMMAAAATLLLFGCSAPPPPPTTDIKKPETTPIPYEELFQGTPEETPDLSADDVFSVWLPYWDREDALLEIDACSHKAEDIIPFAVIMAGADNTPLVLEDMHDTIVEAIEKHGERKNVFLSFTNDVLFEDGTIIQKDLDILRKVLRDEAAMDALIDQLLSLCAEYGVRGIEIDYENIDRFDEDLLSQYLVFIERLYARTKELKMRLRVVIGVFPATYAVFPAGPEYVIMCYNLFGTHSGPGPKADYAFLANAYANNKALPGEVTMAFSTGGFDWVSDGTITGLTEVQAMKLAQDMQIAADDILRDEASGVCRFTFTDAEGLFHEVWYADGETLLSWIALARDYGYHSFAIWRLGGNVNSELKTITQ